MKKRNISSKLVNARTLAIYELDQLIDYIRIVDPELKPNESTAVAAVVLNNLPNLFSTNPLLMDELKKVAAIVKNRQATRNAQQTMN